MKFNLPTGATPLDPNETKDLIPTYINTQNELNQLESDNILEAVQWAYSKRSISPLDYSFMLELHKRMFKDVWKWAGKPRVTEKNIGVPWEHISSKVFQLIKNIEYWIDNEVYSFDEIAVRFHHGLVKIHIFPNGNGRHARLITNLLLRFNNKSEFSWGRNSSSDSIDFDSAIRKKYISSLKNADNNNFKDLISFVRS